jgi:histidinol-phosphate aminotransferase
MTLNVLGIAAATAALGDTAHTARQVTLNAYGRARTVQAFERLGCRVARSDTNFVMVDVKRPSPEFQARCAAQGVFVGRPFPPLDSWARITIGTADEMTRALDVFARVLRPGSA